MRNGRVTQDYVHQLCAGIFTGLANAVGDLIGLPLPHPDPALLVSYDHHSAEAKTAATLDHLG